MKIYLNILLTLFSMKTSDRHTVIFNENDSPFIPKYTMGIAVRLTGLEANRIRRYEEAGLLEPARTPGVKRLFTDFDINLIKEIADLESRGVNLKGIKIILSLRHGEKNM